MISKKHVTTAAIAAVLVALGADAQRQGATGGSPARMGGAPVQAQAQAQARAQTRTQSPSMQGVGGVRAREAARRNPPARGSAQWHEMRRYAAQEMVRAEHQYRWRMARIERMQQLYRQMGRTDRLAELDQMHTRTQDRLRDCTNECRLDLGDRDYDRLQQRIHDRDVLQDRDHDRIHQNP